MMKDFVVIGCGGFGRETAEIAKTIMKEKKDLNLIGFIDDNKELHGKIINNVPVLGNLQWVKDSYNGDQLFFVCAVGEPSIKKKVVERALRLGYTPHSLIHPSVLMYYDVSVGEGTILCPGSIITTNITIGNHVIINKICSIGHDAIIEDFVTINPLSAIGGGAHLEEGVFIGAGTSVLQYIKVGQWSVIGAGATVIRDQEAYVTAVGVPAKVKKKRTIEF
jgi:sugar O-acyltransferase (sialic acid O-acetyltransferase NeuD family)